MRLAARPRGGDAVPFRPPISLDTASTLTVHEANGRWLWDRAECSRQIPRFLINGRSDVRARLEAKDLGRTVPAPLREPHLMLGQRHQCISSEEVRVVCGRKQLRAGPICFRRPEEGDERLNQDRVKTRVQFVKQGDPAARDGSLDRQERGQEGKGAITLLRTAEGECQSAFPPMEELELALGFVVILKDCIRNGLLQGSSPPPTHQKPPRRTTQRHPHRTTKQTSSTPPSKRRPPDQHKCLNRSFVNKKRRFSVQRTPSALASSREGLGARAGFTSEGDPALAACESGPTIVLAMLRIWH